MQAYTDGDPLSFCPYYGYVFPGPHHPGKAHSEGRGVGVGGGGHRAEYGLNEPLFTQYLSYIGGVLHGDLGISYQDPAVRVTEVIARAWPVTASVGAAALIVSLILGTGLGILSAVSGRRSVKQVISAGGMIAAGIPGFAAAILLMLVFSVKLKLLPASGLLSRSITSCRWRRSRSIRRPWSRWLVSSTLETELTKDYVLFARAKGLGRRQVIFTHALKNAYLPVSIISARRLHPC